ncbi:MAG: DNA-formamidopyrimidine glycosylase family protein [Microthrixaceae bacterium]
MPELPEIRVHAERLEAAYAGRVLTRTQAISFSALKTFSPTPDAALGEALSSVGTRGKFFLLRFPSAVFVVHLMQGGRLTLDSKLSAKPRGGLFRWHFDQGPALLLTEPGTERKAGVWVIAPGDETVAPLDQQGPEADQVTPAMLDAILTEAKGARLHGVLRDQHRIAGIGRRLANEVCWAAQISPFAPANKLGDDDRVRLMTALDRVIAAGFEDERTRDHMANSADRASCVHRHTGDACPRCGDTIREVTYNAYQVNYCPSCQTKGKVLADNTTSKFLK